MRYRVVRDYQGGEFGMGRDYTAMEWLEQMTEWSEMDEWMTSSEVYRLYTEEI